MKHTVVARYLDGKVVKGTTEDYAPTKELFTLSPSEAGIPAKAMTIFFRDLKAVFFVKSLAGDREYQEKKLQIPDNAMGRRVLVTFKDGEVMRGTTLGTNLHPQGFLLFPADPGSNNKRIFVVRSAVRDIREEK